MPTPTRYVVYVPTPGSPGSVTPSVVEAEHPYAAAQMVCGYDWSARAEHNEGVIRYRVPNLGSVRVMVLTNVLTADILRGRG